MWIVVVVGFEISDIRILCLSVVNHDAQSPAVVTVNIVRISPALSAVNNETKLSEPPGVIEFEYFEFWTVIALQCATSKIQINRKLKKIGFFMAIANLYARARVHDIFSV